MVKVQENQCSAEVVSWLVEAGLEPNLTASVGADLWVSLWEQCIEWIPPFRPPPAVVWTR